MQHSVSNVKISTSNSVLGITVTANYTFCYKYDGEEEQTEQNSCSILFAGTPLLLIRKSMTKIDMPERFGKWDTLKEKKAYVRAFISYVDTPHTP